MCKCVEKKERDNNEPPSQCFIVGYVCVFVCVNPGLMCVEKKGEAKMREDGMLLSQWIFIAILYYRLRLCVCVC